MDDYENARLLLDATPLACRLWNRDFEIFELNDEAVKLFKAKDKQEVIDKYFELSPEFQPDGQKSHDKAFALFKETYGGEGRNVFEWMHKTLDGEPIPAEITLIRVPYGDEYVVAGYTRDLREQKTMLYEIEQRDKLLSAGNNAVEKLLSTGDDSGFETELLESLEIVGGAVDADCVQIWRNEIYKESLYYTLTHQWLSGAGDIKRSDKPGYKISYDSRPGWEELFGEGRYLNGPVSEMPESNRAYLDDYGIKTFLAIPLFINESFWGLFVIEDCKHERFFSADEVSILRSVSLMLVSALNRNAQAIKTREAYNHARVLLEKTPFACHLWNRNYEMFDCNEENLNLFKVRDKREIMKRFPDFIPELMPDGRLSVDVARALVKQAFDEGKCVYDEFPHIASDGTMIPAELTLVRIPYDDDYVVAVYLRDLREYKRMMKEINETSDKLEAALTEAQNANNAKSDFLAKMSHEMRTPLNAVLGLSELSLDSDRLEEEDKSNLDKIYSAGSTLLSTVNDILDISKIEAGRFELVEIDYELASVVNDAVTQNFMRIGEKPINLALDITGDAFARLHGDELRVKQIINNLLSNAIKYTDQGSVELYIRCSSEQKTEKPGNKVRLDIRVSDTGKGIRKEDIGKLFSDYSQLDTKVNHMIEGTGLGLTITKNLAEIMGGYVGVESEYKKGSVFSVSILQGYISDDRIGADVAENLREFRYSAGKRGSHTRLNRIRMPYARVLVVDDNLTNLEVAKGLMKPYGMKIDCVSSGEKAIDAIKDESVRYSAVFMDHMMPGMDGMEATAHIRELETEYARNIPIIALTANAVAGNEEMFLNNGFQAFLSKPIDIPRLDEIVRIWVRDKEKEKELSELEEDFRGHNNRREIYDRRSGIDRRKSRMNLAGLDISDGIERFGGDEDAYFTILRSYAVNTRTLLESMEEVTEAKLADYAISVHGIKGSSRGIMAKMIGDSAENLELAAKKNDYDYVKKHNKTFLDVVWKLIFDIETMFASAENDEKKPAKDRPEPEDLKKLSVACEAHDMMAVDEIMDELKKFNYTSDDGLVEWLSRKADSMDYKAMAGKLL